ncbi:hypothetical protein F3Y22_tig00111238pilonHSYRG00262 [Hibiscus syriacus]|uniref:Uncharacterized protein n=1 Tax=Hibiscus syriacus TaxID=106335 RepID=A0A6A2YT95_HIBSY|nr:hypothetical protein F3Y22_tig00111238pilonHSYRG00262 [Hibiscus syriacus]
MQCISVYGSPEEKSEDRRRLSSTVEIDDDDLGSCSSSSIGRNSDDSGESQSDDDDSPEAEVKSQPKGPLDTWMLSRRFCPRGSLVLCCNITIYKPKAMRCLDSGVSAEHGKGISQFYNGKSKSFTSVAYAVMLPLSKILQSQKIPTSIQHQPNQVALGSATISSDINQPHHHHYCLPPLHPPCKKSTTSRPLSSSTNRPNPPADLFLIDLQFIAAGTPNIAGFAVHSGNKGNILH